MTDIQLYTKLSSLPNDLKKQVEDFIDFLKTKANPPSGKNKRVAGLAKGMIKMKQGFDDPIDDFKEYM